LTLRLQDGATGQPVLTPGTAFSVGGNPVWVDCLHGQADGQCDTWQFSLVGPTTLHVAVSGFQPADVMTDVKLGPAQGCDCPMPLNPADSTLQLAR
jgi:hypothetical protein